MIKCQKRKRSAEGDPDISLDGRTIHGDLKVTMKKNMLENLMVKMDNMRLKMGIFRVPVVAQRLTNLSSMRMQV